MKEKYKMFGGWLKFFYFLCIINIVSSSIMIVVLFKEMFQGKKPPVEGILECAEIGITVYILTLIVRSIQIRNPNVPEFIKEKLYFIFAVAILYFFLNTIITIPGSGWQEKNTIALTGSIQTMIWAAIWRTYFEKSDRVQVYYKLVDQKNKK